LFIFRKILNYFYKVVNEFKTNQGVPVGV